MLCIKKKGKTESLIFDWTDFTAETFSQYCLKMKTRTANVQTRIGTVKCGSACIDIITDQWLGERGAYPTMLTYDIYLPSHYGMPNRELPYDYVCGGEIEQEDNNGRKFSTKCTEFEYDEFKRVAEENFTNTIKQQGINKRYLAVH